MILYFLNLAETCRHSACVSVEGVVLHIIILESSRLRHARFLQSLLAPVRDPGLQPWCAVIQIMNSGNSLWCSSIATETDCSRWLAFSRVLSLTDSRDFVLQEPCLIRLTGCKGLPRAITSTFIHVKATRHSRMPLIGRAAFQTLALSRMNHMHKQSCSIT